MKLKNQVLSIEQVQELQELGFDVKKHASLYFVEEKYFVKENFIVLPEQIDITKVPEDVKITPTMTIGDIIEVLPEKIKTYSANADKEIYFYPRINNTGIIYVPAMIDDCIFCSSEDKLINNLFKTLVWCIKEKHIKL